MHNTSRMSSLAHATLCIHAYSYITTLLRILRTLYIPVRSLVSRLVSFCLHPRPIHTLYRQERTDDSVSDPPDRILRSDARDYDGVLGRQDDTSLGNEMTTYSFEYKQKGNERHLNMDNNKQIQDAFATRDHS